MDSILDAHDRKVDLIKCIITKHRNMEIKKSGTNKFKVLENKLSDFFNKINFSFTEGINLIKILSILYKYYPMNYSNSYPILCYFDQFIM